MDAPAGTTEGDWLLTVPGSSRDHRRGLAPYCPWLQQGPQKGTGSLLSVAPAGITGGDWLLTVPGSSRDHRRGLAPVPGSSRITEGDWLLSLAPAGITEGDWLLSLAPAGITEGDWLLPVPGSSRDHRRGLAPSCPRLQQGSQKGTGSFLSLAPAGITEGDWLLPVCGSTASGGRCGSVCADPPTETRREMLCPYETSQLE